MSDPVQMRALVKAITMDGPLAPRQIFWCSASHAEHYVQHNIAEIVTEEELTRPSQNRQLTPTEIKEYTEEFQAREAGIAAAKKSSSESLQTPSTDSQESSEHGAAEPPSASQPAQASQPIKSQGSTLTLPHRKGKK